jgi:hypothetical protein
LARARAGAADAARRRDHPIWMITPTPCAYLQPRASGCHLRR